MRKSSKIIAAATTAILAAAGGTAFTATGITKTGPAAAAQFAGGTVSQSVTGATLHDILYGYGTDVTHSTVQTVKLTFTDHNADSYGVTLTPTGGTGVAFECSAVETDQIMAGEPAALTDTATSSSDCTSTGWTGLTSLAVTVASTVH